MRARWAGAAALVAAAYVATACEELPADLAGYETRCLRMNATPLPARADDPHAGTKVVYACGVDAAALRARPFPDGALIIKEATRVGETHPWLVATARKRNGAWRWDEYTRNFADEPFVRVLVAQSVCTGCHDDARGADFIFTAAD